MPATVVGFGNSLCVLNIRPRSMSRNAPGRGLIRRMAGENRWRARKIQAELLKPGLRVSLSTISRYLTKTEPDPGQQQRWMTSLRNHKNVIAGMEFFAVPTVRFRLLYVWFAIDHGRRRILHFNVTANPTSRWVIQQLRETFPDEPSHRHLLREYVDYYNDERVHTSLQDSPAGRPVESRSSPGANVVGLPRIGGLHHRYAWRKAS